MNGIHDMGGMHGFGAVPQDDAIFHADWERRLYALNRLLLVAGAYNSHESRHATERLAPARYLALDYFQRWLESKTELAIEKDVFSRAELERRTETIAAGNHSLDSVEPPADADPLTAADARSTIRTGVTDRESDPRPPEGDLNGTTEYEPGQTVTVRNAHPPGHTRCPRYARGATGTVQALKGTFELPDASAHGEEVVEPCYAVRFSLDELWGAAGAEDDYLTLDLWESYLTT
jgi:nitrile hydratase